jgi:hypothetical protein
MFKPLSVATLLIISETEAQLMAVGVAVGTSVADGVGVGFNVGIGVGVRVGATSVPQPKAIVTSAIISKAVSSMANLFIARVLQLDEL